MQTITNKIKRAWLTTGTALILKEFIESLGYTCKVASNNVITINKKVSVKHSDKIVGYMSCLQKFDYAICKGL